MSAFFIGCLIACLLGNVVFRKIVDRVGNRVEDWLFDRWYVKQPKKHRETEQ